MDQKATKRVNIAKDALAWIEAGALTPYCGVYLDPTRYPTNEEIDSGIQLRDIVLGPCKVCAKGALFIAKAVRYNNVKVDQWREASYYDGPLTEHFDREQLRLIETCFEGWDIDYIDWKNNYPDPKDRLVAILQNIIDNDGTFVAFPSEN